MLPPPFEWCEIPAGKVTIEYSETDHKTFDVPQFWMAQYPITNAQYQVFVDAEDGYRDPSWWGYSDHAKLWRIKNSLPHEITFEGELLPRTNVTWHEAMAFSIWLTMQLNLSKVLPKRQITLPTEQMWQRASQGNDNRKYPWGNVFNETYANTKESNLGGPIPVTQYPNGASPAGVMGMSGNIWEWCVSGWNTSPVDIVNNNDNLRVLRGGSWIGGQTMAKSNYREKYRPDLRDYFIGFRVACMIAEE